VIFDGSAMFLDSESRIPMITTSKSYHVISGNYKYYKKSDRHPKIKFFPFWAVWMSKPYAPCMFMGNHCFSNLEKKYKVSCLNGTEWDHRKLIYLALKEKSYFDNIIFTFNHRNHYNSLPSDIILTADEIKRFNLLKENKNK
jgi:hypothetical protein